MSAFRVQIIGDKEMLRRLNRLSGAKVRAVARPAVRFAMTPINKAAKAKVPRDSNALQKSLGFKAVPAKNVKNKGDVVGGIRPRKGFARQVNGRTRDPRFYAHLVERGTKNMRARPFLRPAIDANASLSLSRFGKKMWERIRKVVAK